MALLGADSSGDGGLFAFQLEDAGGFVLRSPARFLMSCLSEGIVPSWGSVPVTSPVVTPWAISIRARPAVAIFLATGLGLRGDFPRSKIILDASSVMVSVLVILSSDLGSPLGS